MYRTQHPIAAGALAVLFAALSLHHARAEAPGTQMAQLGGASPAVQPPVTVPNAGTVMLLIHSTLLTLNDAVKTGNFTVLRDKAAPSFQAANTAAQLSIIFRSLTQQSVDLSSVTILTPLLTQAPAIDAKQRLRLRGYFVGAPTRIDFNLVFEAVDGHWRLFGISVNPEQAARTAASYSFANAAKPALTVGKGAFRESTEPAKAPKN